MPRMKIYAPSHKQGDVCPKVGPALVERGNNDDNSDSKQLVIPFALLRPVHHPIYNSVVTSCGSGIYHTTGGRPCGSLQPKFGCRCLAWVSG